MSEADEGASNPSPPKARPACTKMRCFVIYPSAITSWGRDCKQRKALLRRLNLDPLAGFRKVKAERCPILISMAREEGADTIQRPGNSILSLIWHCPLTLEIELSPINLGALPSFFTIPNLPAPQCSQRSLASVKPPANQSAKPSSTSACTSCWSNSGSSRADCHGSSQIKSSSGGFSAISVSRHTPEGGIGSRTPVDTPACNWSGKVMSTSFHRSRRPLRSSRASGWPSAIVSQQANPCIFKKEHRSLRSVWLSSSLSKESRLHVSTCACRRATISQSSTRDHHNCRSSAHKSSSRGLHQSPSDSMPPPSRSFTWAPATAASLLWLWHASARNTPAGAACPTWGSTLTSGCSLELGALAPCSMSTNHWTLPFVQEGEPCWELPHLAQACL